MIDLMFMKELILTKQLHQKSVIFVTNCIFYIKRSSCNPINAIDVMIY